MTLTADIECPDQTGHRRNLIWTFTICTCPEGTFLLDTAQIWCDYNFLSSKWENVPYVNYDICTLRKLRAVCGATLWSESQLSIWRRQGSLVINKNPSKDSNQTALMHKLLWLYNWPTFKRYILCTRHIMVHFLTLWHTLTMKVMSNKASKVHKLFLWFAQTFYPI